MTPYAQARAFLYRNARPLDMARFRFHLESGARDDVLAALSAYQNEDGGFGHGLESDAWNPHSAPLQTQMAARTLLEIGWTDASHPVVRGMLRYLGSGAHCDGRFWASSVPSNNDYPHAPWWHHDGDGAPEESYNPTIALAGFALRFADRGDALHAMATAMADAAIARYLAQPESDMHTLLCYIDFEAQMSAAGIDARGLSDLRDKLVADVAGAIERDTSAWASGYRCMPSTFIRSPSSPFYPGQEALCDAECDALLRTQREDGAWAVPWSWADYDAEAFAISANRWRCSMAVDNLLFLRAFGRL